MNRSALVPAPAGNSPPGTLASNGAVTCAAKHVLQALALLDQLRNLALDREDHVAIGNEIAALDQGAVSGHQPGVRAGRLHGEVERLQHALERAAIVDVDERIAVIAVVVADHDGVGFLEPDHGVAAGMGRPDRNQIDDLVVEMNPHRLAQPVGHHRKPGRIAGGRRAAVERAGSAGHAGAQLLAGKDGGAELGEFGVAGGMVAMDVGVDQEADRRLADAPDRRQHLVAELGVLGIDHQDAVGAGQHADAAAGGVLVRRIEPGRAGQHVEIGRDLIGDDLDLVVVQVLRARARAQRRAGQRASNNRAVILVLICLAPVTEIPAMTIRVFPPCRKAGAHRRHAMAKWRPGA